MTAAPKRRYFRYSLRTLFVLVTLVCVAAAWYVERVRPQVRAVAAMRAASMPGNSFRYSYELPLTSPPRSPAVPQWLINSLGVDTFYSVVQASTTVDDAGAYWLGRLVPGLRVLAIEGPQLTDEGVVHLARLSKLEDLHVVGEQITDDSVRSLARLDGLKRLGLCEAAIEGKSLGTLSACAKLEQLNLGGCQCLTDAGLAEVAKLKSLQSLVLGGCREVHGRGLAELAALPNLESLDLSQCHQLTRADFAELARLKHLRQLWFYSPSVDDACVSELAALPALESLNLRFCENVTGSGLAKASGFPRLKKVDLQQPAAATALPTLAERCETLQEVMFRMEAPVLSREMWLELRACPRLSRVEIFSWDSYNFHCRLTLDAGPTRLTIAVHEMPACDVHEIAAWERPLAIDLEYCEQLDDPHLRAILSQPGLQLERINLRHTGVTAQGIDELRRAFPACEVEWDPSSAKPIPRGIRGAIH